MPTPKNLELVFLLSMGGALGEISMSFKKWEKFGSRSTREECVNDLAKLIARTDKLKNLRTTLSGPDLGMTNEEYLGLFTGEPTIPFAPADEDFWMVFNLLAHWRTRALQALGFDEDGNQIKNHPIKWTSNPLVDEPELYSEIAAKLEDTIVWLSQSNSLSLVPDLDETRRLQLLVSLKTIIKMLEGPMIERSLIEGTKSELTSVGVAIRNEAVSQSTKKGVEGAIWALGQIAWKLKDFIPFK